MEQKEPEQYFILIKTLCSVLEQYNSETDYGNFEWFFFFFFFLLNIMEGKWKSKHQCTVKNASYTNQDCN